MDFRMLERKQSMHLDFKVAFLVGFPECGKGLLACRCIQEKHIINSK
jgi:hypothetical protein